MKSYRWRAYTAEGKLKSGLSVAADKAALSSQLRADGLFPEAITEAVQVTPTGRRRRKGLNADMQAVLARQMAVLIDSGLPVEQALTVAQSASKTGAIDLVASRARALVLEGAPLSEALENAQSGFPPFVISAIRAGEASRDLAAVLTTIATHLENRRAERAVLATALIYPAFVAAVSLLVCGILMATVAPQLAVMFETTGRPLPGLTLFMLSATNWIGRNAPLLLALGGAVVLGVPLALRQPAIRNWWDRTLVGVPGIGGLIRQEAAEQYLRALALIISSRQPVLDGTRHAANVLKIAEFRADGAKVTEAIAGGSNLSAALAQTRFIPPIALQLIEAGEKSARVAQMTERAAMIVETGLTNDRKRIVALIDPLLMILIGSFVLTVVLSILLPIFDMQGAIQP